jgi:hypothetical protein
MIINGRKLKGPNIEHIIIPKLDENGNEFDVIFRAEAVLDYQDFEKLCPRPKPPEIMKRGVGIISNPEDPAFKKQVERWSQNKIDWMIITSLRATENLIWEKVHYDNPDTWSLYEQELKESGFSHYEIQRIINGVMIANSLDESKIEEARKRFFSGQGEQLEGLLSHNGEQKSTQSGKHVKD